MSEILSSKLIRGEVQQSLSYLHQARRDYRKQLIARKLLLEQRRCQLSDLVALQLASAGLWGASEATGA